MRKPLFALGLLCWASLAQAAAPTIDTSSTNSNNGDNHSYAGLITTTGTNEVVVVMSSVRWNDGVNATSSGGVTGCGLTWTKRKSIYQGPIALEEWWAPAASTVSSCYAVFDWTTVASNFTNAVSNSVAFKGALNYLAPFDTSPSLPASSQSAGGTSTTVQLTGSGYSTLSNNTFGLYMYGSLACFGGSGMSLPGSDVQKTCSTSGGTSFWALGWLSAGSQGIVTNSAATAGGSNSQQWWNYIVDAIASEAPPVTSFPRSVIMQ